MSDLILAVRLTADGQQLVGQLSAAQIETKGLKAALAEATGSSKVFAASQSSAAADTRTLTAAQKEQARSAAEAAREQTRAAQAVQSSLNRQRQGYQQVGYQAQDFFTQIAGGTSITTAFAQQSGQMAQALQILGAEAKGTSGFIGGLAGFLGGPWGIALGVAIPLATLFASELFKTSEAAKAAELSSDGLATAQAALGDVFDLVSGKLKTQNELLLLNARLTAINLRGEALKAQTEGEKALGIARSGGLGLDTTNRVLGAFGIPVGSAFRRADAAQALADDFRAGRISADQALRRGELLDFTGLNQTRETFLSGINQARAAPILRARAAAIDRSLDSGQLDPSLRRDPPDRRGRSGPSAEAAERRRLREVEQLRALSDRAGDSVARINDRWSAQPTLVQQAREAMRDLDNIAAELERRKPPGYRQLITDVDAARASIQAGLLKPFNDLVEAADRQRQRQLLILQGREQEAEVVARVQQLQDRGVSVTAEQRATIERIVADEERINQLLEKRGAIVGAYQQSIGGLRSSLEDLLSGGSIADFGRSLRDNVERLRGQLLTESLFGDGLRALEQQVRQRTGLEGAVDALGEQTNAVGTSFATTAAAANGLADSLAGAASRIAGGAQAGGAGGVGDQFEQATRDFATLLDGQNEKFFENFARALGPDFNGDPKNPDLVVTANRQASPTITSMKPNDYFANLARVLTAPLVAQLKDLDDALGTKFAGKIGQVLTGGLEGYLSAGPVGAVLGAARSIEGLPAGLSKTLNSAFGGAQTGTQIAQIGATLGIKTSSTGGAIGGAIGAASLIPGGSLVGSIIGSILGGLFRKVKTGVATITGVDSDPRLSGNNAELKSQANSAAGTVQSALQKIADQLGGQVGSFAVSIGLRDGKYSIDPTGRGETKKKRGAIEFGTDGTAAVTAAVFDAISDGGVTGLSAAVQRALRSSTDLDRALREALKVQDVEDIIGGIGNTLQRQFREFEAQAKDRVRIATQYGFDVVKIEERNAEDRKALVEKILSDRVGSLQSLLKDLKYGDLFEGSASDRRKALIAEIATAQTDATAGKDGAASKLADLSRQLVETSREAFGTAGPEYAADRNASIRAAEQVIELENDRIRAAQEAQAATNTMLAENNRLTNETNDILAQIASALGGTSGIFAAQVYSAGGASAISTGRQVAV